MSKSNTFENDLLKLIFNGTPIPGLADNAASSPLTNLYIALHATDPGEDGAQSTNEISYMGYQRLAILRDESGWIVSGGSVSPVASIEFGEMTGGTPGEATHVTIGTAGTGTGKVLYRGAISPTVDYKVGVVPRIRSTSTITED